MIRGADGGPVEPCPSGVEKHVGSEGIDHRLAGPRLPGLDDVAERRWSASTTGTLVALVPGCRATVDSCRCRSRRSGRSSWLMRPARRSSRRSGRSCGHRRPRSRAVWALFQLLSSRTRADVVDLEGPPGPRTGARCGASVLAGELEVVGVEQGAVAHDDGLLEAVLQLAHVARPVVPLEREPGAWLVKPQWT